MRTWTTARVVELFAPVDELVALMQIKSAAGHGATVPHRRLPPSPTPDRIPSLRRGTGQAPPVRHASNKTPSAAAP